MIRWSLRSFPHGPLMRAQISADSGDGGKQVVLGGGFMTRAQLDDLTARLAADLTEVERMRRERDEARESIRAWLRDAERMRPVPAGQATHADCQPIRCLFCTQCGKPLNGDERAAGARVCLVSCAPLADGIDDPSEAEGVPWHDPTVVPVDDGWCMPCWLGDHASCIWDARKRPNVCRCPRRDRHQQPLEEAL